MQASVTCLCTDGALGALCHMTAGGCFLDAAGDCCPDEQPLAVSGQCCGEDEALDEDGMCCETAALDACGVRSF